MLEADIEKFNKQLKKMEKLAPEMHLDVLKKISFDGYTLLVEKTPKDTGRARAGWNVTVDGPPSEWKPPKQVGKHLAGKEQEYQPRPFEGMEKIKFDSVINLTNNVEYIIPLDQGHSEIQAPDGIIKPVITKLKNQLARVLAVLNKRKF
jgi:hypothetical protein